MITVLALACTAAPTPPTEAPMSYSSLSSTEYQRVQADPDLGPGLEQMRSALTTGADAERVSAFLSARAEALARFDAALARGEPRILPAEASAATGPMTHPARAAFDRVSTDVLRAWFLGRADALPVRERAAGAATLAALARDSFPWAPTVGESVAQLVVLSAG